MSLCKGNPVAAIPPLLRNACDACHSSKVKCTGDRQGCRRCQTLGVRCAYSPPGRSGRVPASEQQRKQDDDNNSKSIRENDMSNLQYSPSPPPPPPLLPSSDDDMPCTIEYLDFISAPNDFDVWSPMIAAAGDSTLPPPPPPPQSNLTSTLLDFPSYPTAAAVAFPTPSDGPWCRQGCCDCFTAITQALGAIQEAAVRHLPVDHVLSRNKSALLTLARAAGCTVIHGSTLRHLLLVCMERIVAVYRDLNRAIMLGSVIEDSSSSSPSSYDGLLSNGGLLYLGRYQLDVVAEKALTKQILHLDIQKIPCLMGRLVSRARELDGPGGMLGEIILAALDEQVRAMVSEVLLGTTM